MLEFKIAKAQEDINMCLSIRKQVFIIEQNVPAEIEIDQYDLTSTHFIIYYLNKPVGTARLNLKSTDTAKVERVAVLQNFRNKGIGKYIMQKIIHHSKKINLKTLKLSSQTHAILFYEKLGFKICSEEFIDAGIPHKMMKMELY